MRFPSIALCLTVLVGVFLPAGMATAKEKVIIFHAGSLSVPFEKMEKTFEAAHPDIDILREAGGSTKMARMISELGKPADILASADYAIIDKSLIPEFAEWNIRFASNQLVLCYTPKSRFSEAVNNQNWFDILGRKGVIWGHSDPNLDPCGYRSLMVLQLAEKFYQKPGLYDRLIANRPRKNIRPKSVELVSLLKTGNMDYAWEYLSVAVQHGLQYVSLDEHINLGNYRLDEYYAQAIVKVTGQTPGTWITRVGKSCTYGVTLIKDSPNPEGARQFMEYFLAPDGGLKILKEMGQPPFLPARIGSREALQRLPGRLPDLVEVSD